MIDFQSNRGDNLREVTYIYVSQAWPCDKPVNKAGVHLNHPDGSQEIKLLITETRCHMREGLYDQNKNNLIYCTNQINRRGGFSLVMDLLFGPGDQYRWKQAAVVCKTK